MSEEKKDFVVKDRRVFSEEGPEDETQDTEAAADPAAEAEDQASASAEDNQTEKAHQEPPLPAINFSTFVVSLNASALMNLGAIEDPATGQTNKDLAMAKQTIDILSMLEEKTAGNLSTEESKLLKSILYDLRIIYVKESG